MTDRSIPATSCATAQVQGGGRYSRQLTDSIDVTPAALPQGSGDVCSMNGLDKIRFSTETVPKCVPAVATLIAGAVATFDADRSASRRYLMRASAILQACAAHESENTHVARSRGGLAHWQLTRVVDYVEQHLAERITGEDLASLIDVSIGQLFRAFKASVGMPPLQYVASRRLALACLLLRTTGESPSQIAVMAGFCDQSHLCRVFRRVLGITPAAWRRENAAAPDADSGDRPKRGTPIAARDLRRAGDTKIAFVAQCI